MTWVSRANFVFLVFYIFAYCGLGGNPNPLNCQNLIFCSNVNQDKGGGVLLGRLNPSNPQFPHKQVMFTARPSDGPKQAYVTRPEQRNAQTRTSGGGEGEKPAFGISQIVPDMTSCAHTTSWAADYRFSGPVSQASAAELKKLWQEFRAVFSFFWARERVWVKTRPTGGPQMLVPMLPLTRASILGTYF